MIFWFSVLVFIAGIMTYMLFPRSDAYQIRMYEEEPNIVSFVNQHQAAKDLMYQMITWRDGTEDKIHVLPYAQLKLSLPKPMTDKHDIYTVKTTGSGSNSDRYMTALNPNPDEGVDPSGNYTSAIVCLSWERICASLQESGCAKWNKTAKLIPCAIGDPANGTAYAITAEPYVITYGYIPDWWSDKTMQRQAWFKAILKRTHGSDTCGVLTKQGVDYAIENTQKFTGFEKKGKRSVVPKVVTDALINNVGLNTCETAGCSDPLSDVMFCMSAVPNPYAGTPVFQWDILNNTGTGHESGYQTPLIGAFRNAGSGEINLTENGIYTVTGVVAADNFGQIFTLSDGKDIIENSGKLTAGSVSVDVPAGPYIFVYTGNPNEIGSGSKQKLTVYYTKIVDGEPVWTAMETATSTNAAPTLSNPQLREHLMALRIYQGELQERYLLKNNKADRKRFGLDWIRIQN